MQGDIMVRFTLLNRSTNARMRFDALQGDKVEEVMSAAIDVWGCESGLVLRDGYSLLSPDVDVDDCILDNDVVEVLPDPFRR